ncbi:nucleotidyl transferase AbiEii/AbiGii toxin family protein [Patescibacteria group bacterium]|nr:nucleotidyl transferase AbiEii/AbiGii toxin family protein [Patescibacteria group bacterium]MBU0879223.1 nucleotidyl transferase AbiEii/AbiGii toxin family protein [Patescibacteria group bacterium]MBU0880308.1 nucleotidyl transferase AbiEii/AbiGii toxin family protein [Patescibacteria group bacterium]MBU1062680.1 nucleotidyl transferase AbiEii/AbiGii toxin family protein [Patescibacteria group bacterium]MBU1783006.1 nucleotidyl transferase AbiEii/AbiGii toxin family protein [Patescibacteria 
MYKEILTEEQVKLLPLVKKFMKDFGLVGETAIALQIGHRQSIDFDLFSNKEFDNAEVRKIIIKNGYKINKVYKDEIGQFTFFVDNVQFTFFHYPFKIEFSEYFEKVLRISDLLTLGAMKAYALGRRAKWKDYVDLYFIINKFHSIEKIVKRSKDIFKNEFNERIFREQLSYFNDIDYQEEIEYLKDFKINDKIVKKQLIEFSLEKD